MQSVFQETQWLLSAAVSAGTAGRLLDDGNRMLPLNLDPDTGLPRLPLKNTGSRVPQTQLR